MSSDSELQKPLDDIYIFWLERVTKAFKKNKIQFFKDAGEDLTSDQWVLLKRCHEKPGNTQKDLAESTFKDPASVTRTLDILVKKNLLERKQGQDRRNFEIWLTKNGTALVERMLPLAVEKRKEGLAGIPEAEAQQFVKTLEKIWHNLT